MKAGRAAVEVALAVTGLVVARLRVIEAGVGDGFVAEALVHDETGQFAAESAQRSAERSQWFSARFPTSDWMTVELPVYPRCSRRVNQLETHFYHVLKVC